MVFKKHVDERGIFRELYRGSSGITGLGNFNILDIRQISQCTINPGKTRGGHYHKFMIEAFIILEGSMILRQAEVNLTNPKTPNITKTIMSPTKNHLMYNIPWVWHEVSSEKGCQFLIIQNKEHDPENPDTYRIE